MLDKHMGKICPYCKTKFVPGDDIVVCSQCDMPHHLECWVENQQCTTFGCIGSITNYYEQENSFKEIVKPEMIFCRSCGKRNDLDNSFCPACGNGLREAAPSLEHAAPAPTIPVSAESTQYNSLERTVVAQDDGHAAPTDFLNDEDLFVHGHSTGMNDRVAFIGDNASYYMAKFNSMAMRQSSSSWNWGAFFLSVYWCFYRKMYGYGFAFIGLSVLTSLLSSISPDIHGLMTLAHYAAIIAFGIYGNSLYMKYVDENLQAGRGMGTEQKMNLFGDKGGTSFGAALGALLLHIILLLILNWE